MVRIALGVVLLLLATLVVWAVLTASGGPRLHMDDVVWLSILFITGINEVRARGAPQAEWVDSVAAVQAGPELSALIQSKRGAGFAGAMIAIPASKYRVDCSAR